MGYWSWMDSEVAWTPNGTDYCQCSWLPYRMNMERLSWYWLRSFILAGYFSVFWKLLCMVPEEKNNYQSYLTMNSESYNNHQSGKACPLVQRCHGHHGSNQSFSGWIQRSLYKMNPISGTHLGENTWARWALGPRRQYTNINLLNGHNIKLILNDSMTQCPRISASLNLH